MANTVTLDNQPVPLIAANMENLNPGEAAAISRIQDLVENLSKTPPPVGQKPIIGATDVPPEAEATLKTTAAAAKVLFPNIAEFVIRLGLKQNEIYTKQLHKHADEAAELQQSIELLITLSGKFAIHGDKTEVLISEEIKKVCSELKEKGIEILLKDEGKVTRERISELKALISSHTDLLKTELQKKFTTEIQVKINELNSLLDCLKTIEKHADRLLSTLVSNQIVRG